MTARATEYSNRPAHEIAIVGSDMLLAALPARPVQLSHALLAAGFSLVVPASWGDELLAEHAVRHMLSGDSRPKVYCACPRIRKRLLAAGDELAPHLIGLVAPAVAAARYLRMAWPDQALRIVYIGGCEGADDPAIDERITPAEMLARLDAGGINAARLPVAFRDVIPPDRRRYWSLPGGCPSPEALAQHASDRQLHCVGPDAYAQELVEGLLSGSPVLLDLADALHCACAGRVEVHGVRASREEVTALEPPRAPLPVLDADIVVDVEFRPRLVLSRGSAVARPMEAPAAGPAVVPVAEVPPVPAFEGVIPLPQPPVAGRNAEQATPTESPRHTANRRPMAVTPPGVAVMASREGRQPAPQPIVGAVRRDPVERTEPSPPPAPPPPTPPAVHGLHRIARTRASLRVARDHGVAVPRAFAAVRRGPAVRELATSAEPESDAAPPPVTPGPEPTTPVVTTQTEPPPVASVEPLPDVAPVGIDPAVAHEHEVPVPSPEQPAVISAHVETPRARSGAGIRVPALRVTPIPPPPPPQPRRLRGLLASAALLVALIALVIAVFGF